VIFVRHVDRIAAVDAIGIVTIVDRRRAGIGLTARPIAPIVLLVPVRGVMFAARAMRGIEIGDEVAAIIGAVAIAAVIARAGGRVVGPIFAAGAEIGVAAIGHIRARTVVAVALACGGALGGKLGVDVIAGGLIVDAVPVERRPVAVIDAARRGVEDGAGGRHPGAIIGVPDPIAGVGVVRRRGRRAGAGAADTGDRQCRGQAVESQEMHGRRAPRFCFDGSDETTRPNEYCETLGKINRSIHPKFNHVLPKSPCSRGKYG
jgi:hypothetical protein